MASRWWRFDERAVDLRDTGLGEKGLTLAQDEVEGHEDEVPRHDVVLRKKRSSSAQLPYQKYYGVNKQTGKTPRTMMLRAVDRTCT